MKRCAESEIYSEYLEELPPKLAGESWILMEYDYFRHAVQLKYIVHEDLGILVCTDLFGLWGKINHVGETIHKDNDSCISGRW